MADPAYLQPFVIPNLENRRRRDGRMDVYWPSDDIDEALPAVVFIHGGPVPADMQPTPRDWPVYVGYGSLAATTGIVGITVDHRLHSNADYPTAANDIADVVAQARALPGVDPNRIALWFFSGGGLLSADWLRHPPQWLRCIAATYPLLAPLEPMPDPAVNDRFSPVEAVATSGDLPILLTRVGRERRALAVAVENFISSAERSCVDLEVIDVPDGQHGFDMLDHTDDSRAAVQRAIERVGTMLTR